MNKDVKYVGIRKDLFNEIEEYAKLNGFKTTYLINTLLKDRFMIEKYGESPFDAFAKKIEITETPSEIQKVVNDNFWEMLGDSDKIIETETETNNEDNISKEEITELDKKISESQETTDEHVNSASETNNKPKKRRLK